MTSKSYIEKCKMAFSEIADLRKERNQATIQKRIEKTIGRKPIVIFDVVIENKTLTVKSLNQIALAGRVKIVDDVWDKYENHLQDPTWMELVIESEKMIKVNGDTHHVFLEGYEILNTLSDGTKVIGLDLNS